MKKGITKPLASLMTALALGFAAPAMAETEMLVESFDATIAEAKSNMVKDPAKALSFARQAQTLVSRGSASEAKSALTARWLEGEALMRLNRSDEAAGTIETALSQAAQSFKDDTIYADLLRSAASSKARKGEFKKALAYFEEASERYEKLGDARSRAIVLQNIGSVYSKARNFEQVLNFYRQAAEVYSDNSILSLSANNNMGNALKGLKRYAEAEEKFAAALTIAETMESPLLKARILTNMASAQVMDGATQKAHETAKHALTIADSHAPDWSPFVHGVLAQIELRRGNLGLADEHIGLAFANQPLDETNVLFLDFHETAADIYSRGGKAKLATLHTDACDRINRQSGELKL